MHLQNSNLIIKKAQQICNLKLLTNGIIFSVNSVIFSERTSFCEASVRVKPPFACQELGLTSSHFKISKKTKCPVLIISLYIKYISLEV